jgi:hypothetical protein
MLTAILRPDAKGRIGLDSLTRALRQRFGGKAISGYSAEITADGAIVLRPRVEVDANDAGTFVLSARDRDAFLAALAHPPRPTRALRSAMSLHRRIVRK